MSEWISAAWNAPLFWGISPVFRALFPVCIAATAWAQQSTQTIGSGYSIKYRPEWTLKNHSGGWELVHPRLPAIEIDWQIAVGSDHASAHHAAVAKTAGDPRYGWRDYGTHSVRGSNGQVMYETELGTEVNGFMVRMHCITLLLDGKILLIIGGRKDNDSSVTYAREVANSVEKVESGGKGPQTLIGKWSSPGSPYPAVIIFRLNGTVESDEPIAGRRSGQYKIEGRNVVLTWNRPKETETCRFSINGFDLELLRESGRVRYTRDNF